MRLEMWRAVVGGSLGLLLCAAAIAAEGVRTIDAVREVGAVREVAFRNPIKEFVDANERVSGGAVAGLVFYESVEARSDALYAYLTRGASNGRLSLATVDGRYYAEIDYDLNASRAEWLRLKLPDSTRKRLAGLDQQHVAALFTSDAGDTIHPLRWSAPGPTRFVRAYLNTERAAAFYLDRSHNRRGPCRPPRAPSTFKFDQICDVPMEAVAQSDGTIEIERRAGVRRLEPVLIHVGRLAQP